MTLRRSYQSVLALFIIEDVHSTCTPLDRSKRRRGAPGQRPSNGGARVANVSIALSVALRDKACRVHTAGLRVRVKATGLATYPDVTVICQRVDLDPDDAKGHTATNPKVVVEVLSPSTEAYDRGEKLAPYQRVASLEEVVLVAHDRHEVEVVRREADGSWSRHVASGDDAAVSLSSLGCEIPVGEIYRDPLAPA
jgi:Uma2 family endonuclease